MRALDRLLVLIPLSAVVLLIATWLVPGSGGPYAILTIFTPHLAIAAIVVTALLALVSGRLVRIGLVVLVVATLVRFGDEWLSIPPNAGPASFDVATWNMEWDVPGGPTAIDGLAAVDADVVVLQELTPDQAATIEASTAVTERYPYRRLEPGSVRDGIGLLSRRPLTDVEYDEDPASIRATLGGDGDPITVLTAHPHSPRIRTRGPGPFDVPVGYDVSDRDRRLAEIRTRVDAAIALGPPVVVVGDLNVAPTEAAYRDLTAGLLDAHVEVGLGPGWTWRPGFVGSLPMGLLRIDLILSTADLVPVESRVVCRSVGDHCQVLAGFAPAT